MFKTFVSLLSGHASYIKTYSISISTMLMSDGLYSLAEDLLSIDPLINKNNLGG